MIEIAPNVFVNAWDEVVDGYLHGCGHFIINLTNGQTIAVRDKDDIATTIKYWRSLGQPISGDSSPTKDIELWLPHAKQRTTGKTVF